MKTIVRRQASWIGLILVLLSGFTAVAQVTSEDLGMQVTRSISTAYAVPESVFRVTLVVKATANLLGVGIRETLPIGWTMQPVENAGAAFKRSEGEWVFEQPLEAGITRVIIYEVTIPSARMLLSDPLPQCFEIVGTYQATVPSFETPILGTSSLEVNSTLPISTVIAHLIPAMGEVGDVIDLRLSPTISGPQLDRALELWSHDLPVVGTGGELITLAEMNHLAALYETCTPAHEALPLSIDPQLQAIRTIDTFLPCDSVLLPDGDADPGLAARQVTVRVQITPSYDAYGVALKEWLPSAWQIETIRHTGFVYRPSATEWIYPTRVRAGETIEVIYRLEVRASEVDRLATSIGCCGWEAVIDGEASAGLECSAADVLGEDTVLLQTCVPILLAISRWDVANDRFDARLSNLITYPQVERATAFWAQGQAVPHTCGYTVGYHMLKRIVAYWQSGTPITEALPIGVLDTCDDVPGSCGGIDCAEGTLCRLLEAQDPNDYVGP